MIDKQIMETLETVLKTLPWVKLVSWKKLRIGVSDFRETELPAIQFYGTGQDMKHQHGKLEVTWRISIEVLLKSKCTGELDMGDLFDKQQEVEQVIGANPNLGIPGVIHFRYIGNQSDLYTILPIYYTRLDFECIFHKPYSGC